MFETTNQSILSVKNMSTLWFPLGLAQGAQASAAEAAAAPSPDDHTHGVMPGTSTGKDGTFTRKMAGV